MTIDVPSHHILIAVLPTIHREIIRSSLVFNMVKAVKFIFKLIFSFLSLAMSTPLPIAGYLVILLLLAHTDPHLPDTLPLDRGKLLLVVTVTTASHDHLILLLPATSSLVHVLLLLLVVNVTADAYLLLRDLW
jgi:hypothetical protein